MRFKQRAVFTGKLTVKDIVSLNVLIKEVADGLMFATEEKTDENGDIRYLWMVKTDEKGNDLPVNKMYNIPLEDCHLIKEPFRVDLQNLGSSKPREIYLEDLKKHIENRRGGWAMKYVLYKVREAIKISLPDRPEIKHQ